MIQFNMNPMKAKNQLQSFKCSIELLPIQIKKKKAKSKKKNKNSTSFKPKTLKAVSI